MNAFPTLPGFLVQSSLFETATTRIWRAIQKNLDRQVLVIAFKSEFERDAAYRRQMFEAIRTLSNLKNQLFPDIIDILRDKERFYIILEDANITNILTPLKRKRLSAERLTQIAMQLADGFAILQANDLVYGAFSPKRLYITEDDYPILPAITFIQKGSEFSAKTALAEYSPKDYVWLAPEQYALTTTRLDTRTDIFSVGLSLYALATGQVPFGILAPKVILEFKQSHSIPSPCDILPNFPQPLAAVLAKMTQRNPNDRYSDWDEVRFDLYQAQQGVFPNDPSPSTSVIAPPRKGVSSAMGKPIRLSVKALRKYRTQRKQKRSAATFLLAMAVGLIILIVIALLLLFWRTFL